jgi:hypothetical protein
VPVGGRLGTTVVELSSSSDINLDALDLASSLMVPIVTNSDKRGQRSFPQETVAL